MKTSKHIKRIHDASTSKSMNKFVVQTETVLALQIWIAEGTLAFHTVKHHQSFNSMDCTSVIMRNIFTDSVIAQKMSCARTKTEAIITGVLAPHSIQILIQDLQNVPYLSICTDSSNHGNIKLFPLVLQYFDYAKNGINVRILDLQETTNEKAKTVADMIEKLLNDYNLGQKLIAYSGDNTNTNFGGLERQGNQNIFSLLKNRINKELIGIGCPSHILHNAVHHGFDRCDLFDIDSIVLKIYNYFSIYTVRTKELKDFCEFVEITFRDLLYHSKTRWLSLLPVVHRILQMFQPLKSYFLSQEKPPKVLESFFLHDLAETYLFFVHSLMTLFHEKMLIMEKETNSVLETLEIVDNVLISLRERYNAKFLTLNIKSQLARLRNDGKESMCNNFIDKTMSIYKDTEEYLEKWTQSLSELRTFNWLNFRYNVPVDYNLAEETVAYLKKKNVIIDESKLFDQIVNLNNFLSQQNCEFFKMSSNSKICSFLSSNPSIDTMSEIVLISQFFFAIPPQNSNCERIFSLINTQWSDERNRLCVKTVRDIILVQFNFKHFNCTEFKNYLQRSENVSLLKKIGRSEKYHN